MEINGEGTDMRTADELGPATLSSLTLKLQHLITST